MSKHEYPNSGALFRNEEKDKDSQPDHRGEIHLNCPKCGEESDFWLSAWVKIAGEKSKKPGQKFFSLAVKPKEKATRPSGQSNYDPDEDIPF